jgi:N-dimethylarginine dimethylaminohydrolase
VWQEKLNRAKASIAEDLGLALEDVTFVIQENYHLDLEFAVSPEGVVYQNSSRDSAFALLQRNQLEAAGWRVHSVTSDPLAINGVFVDRRFISLNPVSPEFASALEKEGYTLLCLDGFTEFFEKHRAGLRCLTVDF